MRAISSKPLILNNRVKAFLGVMVDYNTTPPPHQARTTAVVKPELHLPLFQSFLPSRFRMGLYLFLGTPRMR